jgi:hypothetical protein
VPDRSQHVILYCASGSAARWPRTRCTSSASSTSSR